ncbi:MAG: hypothetical protein K6D02_07735 [Lachnospiraceae bacterium]|nr:hypothetical protein [Lachnospiraceae bacterium]
MIRKISKLVSLTMAAIIAMTGVAAGDSFNCFAGNNPDSNVVAQAAAETVETNGFKTATAVSTGSINCVIKESTEKLYYKFVPEKTDTYVISSEGNYDPMVILYDSSESFIASNKDLSTINSNFYLEQSLTAGKTYYYMIGSDVAVSSPISFKVNLYVKGDAAATSGAAVIKNSTITTTKTAYTYTGSEIEPVVKVVSKEGKTLTENEDYYVTYKNNINKGTGTITVVGYAGNVDKKSITFKINAKKVGKVFSLNYTYKGKKITPKIYDKKTKKLYKKTDYTIKKKTNLKKVGTQTVKIKFKGNYKGTKTVKFKILPKEVKKYKVVKKTSDTVTVSFTRVKGATAYRIRRYNSKKKKYQNLFTTKSNQVTVKKEAGSKYNSFMIQTVQKVGKKNYYSEDGCFVSEK